MVNRRSVLKFLGFAVVGVSSTFSIPMEEKEFYVRSFFSPEYGCPSPSFCEKNTIVQFQRTADMHGYTKIGKIKYHPPVWNAKRYAWDVTSSAILS